ncbi:Non-SMC condensin II complex, subunit H2-like protein [Artemisia annua]|uniref:Condensin-2 complex subunit H2 n=1 Tax=Artemisia annua TaxID=35608 RepID=A0A2U1MUN4_ARTAN|nr:Non-SMC condensin II complex, subunit H2-like protein [Artemisia annua]
MNDKEASTSDAGAGKIHTVQAHRDLQSNWEVDIANKLQDYLLKICSGEIQQDDNGLLAVNFAEAALLLQNSSQVYSRKVEYLYSLVLHALEFISKHSQQHDQPESSSGQAEEQNGSVAAPPESDESFWCSDDIPVDPKNSLDSTNDNNTLLHSVKPPANLVVLEGDCLDVNGDSGELETYLLATNDLFRDFILLDASDAVTVDEFLGGKETFNKNKSGLKGGSSIGSKSRKSFMSPSKRSGGTVRKPSAAKTPNPDQNHSARVDNHFETNDHNMPDYNANMDHEFDMDDGFSQPEGFDDSDEEDDDPWKPLNPHEQGNLKVKPFKKVKAFRKEWSNPTTKISITEEFPLAKLHGPVSAELHEIWEAQHNVNEKDKEPQSPPLYEKLRRSLVIGDHVIGDHESNDVFKNDKDKHEEGDGYGDGGAPDIDTGFMDEDDFDPEKQPIDDATQCDSKEPFEHEDPNAHVNLEDLCRSHLDSLLASCTETEKQSALAARVSTWKQRIEKNLDEQDARPPFDIHEYGQRTLDKLSQEADVGKSLAFTDVVRGQEKHEVARTFSALLQLVNNGNVELIKGGGVNGQFVCYTGENPFHVRLLSNIKRPEVQLRSSNKRPKPQLRREKENNIPGTSSSPSPSPFIISDLCKGRKSCRN